MLDERGQLIDPLSISKIRHECAQRLGAPSLLKYKCNTEDIGFSNLKVGSIALRGPITPDHVISTKRIPAVLDEDFSQDISSYVDNYKKYFEDNKSEGHICLDPIPRWMIVKGKGSIVLGPDPKRVQVISDIVDHTQKCIQWGEALGGWRALPEKDIFDLEYWELEQAKLKVGKKALEFTGRVALVTGAASGIGKACVKGLLEKGCSVAALDLNEKVEKLFSGPQYLGLKCNVTQPDEIRETLKKLIFQFGGIDFLVSNAGNFPKSCPIEETQDENWDQSIDLNLSSHFRLLRECTPYLKHGWDPAVIFIGSKNVSAPGPGVASYSVSKAGLTQLARVAALELGPLGIRVNAVHPNAVFDTGIWSSEVVEQRAGKYGLSPEEYKKNNILGTTINSEDVANIVATMLGKSFQKTTGAQVPIDGGNERVI